MLTSKHEPGWLGPCSIRVDPISIPIRIPKECKVGCCGLVVVQVQVVCAGTDDTWDSTCKDIT